MKVISTNLGKATSILWNGKKEQTGIFKYPVRTSIVLEKNDVFKDTIIDRKHHGGEHKACYLFSANHYPYWKEKYPDLKWDWGMFGENLTVEDLDESKIRIGNVYRIGTALVQITQPREPCYKLGIRFGTQEILKQFIDHGFPGTYIKILEVGEVNVGDSLELVQESENTLTVQQFYELLFSRSKNMDLIRLAVANKALPEYKRNRLRKYLQ
nr:MOSC domain-containing protein [uncultured Allomuricauda sp.]